MSTRYKVVKDFSSFLRPNDIAIFSGEDLSREAFEYDREGNFYILDSYGQGCNLALGLAIHTDKRIFSFVGDGEFMLEFGSAPQAAVSRCLNLYYVILDNGCYQTAGGHPTILREINSIKGCLFNLGFVVYDFTEYFRNKNRVAQIENVVGTMRGPAAIIIKVDKRIKKDMCDVGSTKIDLKDRLVNFIAKSSGTSLFVPPM